MKSAEDQVVDEDTSFQEDEVRQYYSNNYYHLYLLTYISLQRLARKISSYKTSEMTKLTRIHLYIEAIYR